MQCTSLRVVALIRCDPCATPKLRNLAVFDTFRLASICDTLCVLAHICRKAKGLGLAEPLTIHWAFVISYFSLFLAPLPILGDM